MKLTKEDKEILLSMGYEKDDFPQIEETTRTVKFKIFDEEMRTKRRIGIREASEILSKYDFLSGLARSAFHFSAVRVSEKGENVHFDNSKMFDYIVR